MPAVVSPPSPGSGVRAWLRAAHAVPSLAVTGIAGLLAVDWDVSAGTWLVLVAAVLTGQLTVGWANDLVDVERDRRVGRRDKPLATGQLRQGPVRLAVIVAGLACVGLSLMLGGPAAAVHLGLFVAFGHVYNLWLKATPWSWLPYAVAFGALPGVVTLAQDPPAAPAAWMVLTGAMLGVGAHFLNALPDLADDEATGVRGLPHRVGATGSRRLATALLVAASLVCVLTWGTQVPWGAALVPLVLVALLATVALTGKGERPFQAAIVIAVIDVSLLAVVGS